MSGSDEEAIPATIGNDGTGRLDQVQRISVGGVVPGPLRITRTGRDWTGAASTVIGPRACPDVCGIASHRTTGVSANAAAAHFNNKGMMERVIPIHQRQFALIMHGNRKSSMTFHATRWVITRWYHPGGRGAGNHPVAARQRSPVRRPPDVWTARAKRSGGTAAPA